MKIKMVQIGTKIPENLEQHIAYNRRYADRHKMTYEYIEIQNAGRHKYVSAYSDFLRVQILSKNPNTLFLCWDAILIDNEIDFSLPFRARDTIIFNGDDTRTYENALEYYDNYKKSHPLWRLERHRVWKILQQRAKWRKYNKLNRYQYLHNKSVDWSKINGPTSNKTNINDEHGRNKKSTNQRVAEKKSPTNGDKSKSNKHPKPRKKSSRARIKTKTKTSSKKDK